MDANRRGFFRLAAGVCAVPVVGVAKAVGVTPKLAAPAPFRHFEVLTAERLNEQFDNVIRSIEYL